jgi:hypothetical protein
VGRNKEKDWGNAGSAADLVFHFSIRLGIIALGRFLKSFDALTLGSRAFTSPLLIFNR